MLSLLMAKGGTNMAKKGKSLARKVLRQNFLLQCDSGVFRGSRKKLVLI